MAEEKKEEIAVIEITEEYMKERIYEIRGQRELLQLSMENANNRIEISKINSDMISLEKQISDVAEGLKDVVTMRESFCVVLLPRMPGLE